MQREIIITDSTVPNPFNFQTIKDSITNKIYTRYYPNLFNLDKKQREDVTPLMAHIELKPIYVIVDEWNGVLCDEEDRIRYFKRHSKAVEEYNTLVREYPEGTHEIIDITKSKDKLKFVFPEPRMYMIVSDIDRQLLYHSRDMEDKWGGFFHTQVITHAKHFPNLLNAMNTLNRMREHDLRKTLYQNWRCDPNSKMGIYDVINKEFVKILEIGKLCNELKKYEDQIKACV